MTRNDPITDRILRELSRDGRMTNLDLAERVGLSPSACLRRVQDLERRGVIRGYRARLDPAQTGRGFVVYVTVGLAEHSKAAQEAFEAAMARADAVTECYNIAGAVRSFFCEPFGGSCQFISSFACELCCNFWTYTLTRKAGIIFSIFRIAIKLNADLVLVSGGNRSNGIFTHGIVGRQSLLKISWYGIGSWQYPRQSNQHDRTQKRMESFHQHHTSQVLRYLSSFRASKSPFFLVLRAQGFAFETYSIVVI